MAPLSLALVVSCAKVLGVDDTPSSIEDICSCDQLKPEPIKQRCMALASARSGDQAFVQGFVKAGCPSCPIVARCLEILGASADGQSCGSDPDCASTHCCAGTCCSGCHGCAGSAPHCTSLFDQTSACLMMAHASLCSVCPAAGPAVYGDDCWACLTSQDQQTPKCSTEIAACTAEGT